MRAKRYMRNESPKHAKRRRETNPHRRAYVDSKHGVCESCDRNTMGTDNEGFEQHGLACHEITAGSYRDGALDDANLWLALCLDCHEKLQGADFIKQESVKRKAVAKSINRSLGRMELEP